MLYEWFLNFHKFTGLNKLQIRCMWLSSKDIHMLGLLASDPVSHALPKKMESNFLVTVYLWADESLDAKLRKYLYPINDGQPRTFT